MRYVGLVCMANPSWSETDYSMHFFIYMLFKNSREGHGTTKSNVRGDLLRNFTDMHILNKKFTTEKTNENADELNTLTGIIIGAAIEFLRLLGQGLLESAYEACLAFELIKRGLKIERQVELPL